MTRWATRPFRLPLIYAPQFSFSIPNHPESINFSQLFIYSLCPDIEINNSAFIGISYDSGKCFSNVS